MTERHRRSAPGTRPRPACTTCGATSKRGVIVHTATCTLFPSDKAYYAQGVVEMVNDPEPVPVDNRPAFREALAALDWAPILGAWYPPQSQWGNVDGNAVQIHFDSINDDDVLIHHERDGQIWTVALTGNTPIGVMLAVALTDPR